MKKKHLILLGILSSFLLSIPFFEWGSGIVLFIAFIPLLFIADHFIHHVEKKPVRKASFWAGFVFLLWNLATTFWIMHATFLGMIAAELISTFLMTLTFAAFLFTAKKLGEKYAGFAFVIFWISFEMFFMNSQLSWSWLILGNGFANDIFLVQWYEYTGSIGGSLWVLVVNVGFFRAIKKYIADKSIKPIRNQLIGLMIIVFLPMAFSVIKYHTYKEVGLEKNFLLIQPNIDPYTEKFGSMTVEEQVDKMLKLAAEEADSTIDFIIAPETVMDYLWLNTFEQNRNIKEIRRFIRQYPRANFIFGATTLYRFQKGEDLPFSARKFQGSESEYYDVYNSAIQLDSTKSYQLYHKSKLVAGVEKMPYPKLMKVFSGFITDLGGTSGTRGTQENREVFESSDGSARIAPVICFESVFGDYMTDYIKEGASYVAIITNDGWWRDTPGYKQHLSFARLRAIETRRSIGRSANTGISAFINQRGDILQQTDWWQEDVLKGRLRSNEKLTIYVKYGDYIGRISVFFSILIFLIALVFTLKQKTAEMTND